jgi:hypothetical protein
MSGFGAKVDMIPAHCNEVNRNQIWREHVGKEVKKFVPGGTFQLFSPKKVSVVVVKPPMAQRMPTLPPLSPRTQTITSEEEPLGPSAQGFMDTVRAPARGCTVAAPLSQQLPWLTFPLPQQLPWLTLGSLVRSSRRRRHGRHSGIAGRRLPPSLWGGTVGVRYRRATRASWRTAACAQRPYMPTTMRP